MKLKSYVYIVGIAAVITIVRFLIIYHYVGLRFLWGGDQVPIIGLANFIRYVFLLAIPWVNMGILFIPQLSIVILNNIPALIVSLLLHKDIINGCIFWISNNLAFFIALIVLWYAISSFEYINTAHKFLAFLILCTFFAFNPWCTIDTFKSYLEFTSLRTALLFVFISFYFRIIKNFKALGKRTYNVYDILVIVSTCIVLSSISPSAAVRFTFLSILFAFITLIFEVITIYIYKGNIENYTNRRNSIFRVVLRTIIMLIIPIVCCILVLIIYLVAGYFKPLEHRVISRWGSLIPPKRVLHPTYGKIIYSFIGMTSWIAHSIYMPYHVLYEKGVLAGLMFLWPLITFVGIFFVITRARYFDASNSYIWRMQLLMLISLAVLALAWGTALNSPFALIKGIVVHIFPIIVKIMPWGFSSTYITYFYILSASYIIGMFVVFSRNLLKSLGDSIYKYSLSVFAVLTILAVLLFTALPIFNGSVFGQYFNSTIKGFILPSDYAKIVNLNVPFYEHILLLPQTPVYSMTSWGWQGSVAWYHGLNGAIIVPGMVPYSQYTKLETIYRRLTRPCLVLKGTKFNITRYIDTEKIHIFGGNIELDKLLLNGTLYTVLLVKKKDISIVVPLKHSLNISRYKWIKIEVCIQSYVKNVTLYVSPWVFICSGKFAGVHILATNTVPSCFSKTYAVGVPDKPWPLSTYNPSNITGFVIRLRFKGLKKLKGIILKILFSIIVSNKATLCKNYLRLLNLLNVKYIIMDRSLRQYNKFYQLLSTIFSKMFRMVYNGVFISIWENNGNFTPFSIVHPKKDVGIHFVNINPYNIKAIIDLRCRSKKILITFPLVYSKAIPCPIKVIAYSGRKTLNVKMLNYRGTVGFLIETANSNTVHIVVRYTFLTLVVYITWIAIDLLPLLLLLVALILTFIKKHDTNSS